MGENGQGDHFTDTEITTSFSQLLFSDINESDGFCPGNNLGPLFDCSPAFKSPKMLCFNSPVMAAGAGAAAGGAATAVNGVNFNVNGAAIKPNRRRNGPSDSMDKASRSCKKIKLGNPCNSTSQPKARKEKKLGERIATLQQLVSPFGKTDTASVLHEAMGYIRFLHDQLQVLCSPYLQQPPLSEGKENGVEEPSKELRSRGLCLVPVESTLHVASNNGADYWSSAMSATRQ